MQKPKPKLCVNPYVLGVKALELELDMIDIMIRRMREELTSRSLDGTLTTTHVYLLSLMMDHLRPCVESCFTVVNYRE